MSEAVPRVVIVGGGFGGLAAAKALRKSNVDVVLIDRQNHHLFQPLLYQVVTSVLSPGQIASPIRGILGKQRSTTVILGEVSVDAERRRVFVDSVDRADVGIDYDYLRFSRPARATATSATTNSNSSPRAQVTFAGLRTAGALRSRVQNRSHPPRA